MEFSLRDTRGQALVEYLLVLTLTVMLVLGGIYQLNGAFKVWANNYFGNYLSCLLETGELPSLGGTPGDSSICNELFKPFSAADGRPLFTPGQNGQSSGSPPSASGSSGGQRERDTQGASGSAGNYIPTHRSALGGGRGGAGGSGQGKSFKRKSDDTYTGSTAVSNTGGYKSKDASGTVHHQQIDNGFAFQEEQETAQRKSPMVSQAKPNSEGGNGGIRTRKVRRGPAKDAVVAEGSEFTFGNFLRYLIIIAIIIALVVFLGGQMLQVGKSME